MGRDGFTWAIGLLHQAPQYSIKGVLRYYLLDINLGNMAYNPNTIAENPSKPFASAERFQLAIQANYWIDSHILSMDISYDFSATPANPGSIIYCVGYQIPF